MKLIISTLLILITFTASSTVWRVNNDPTLIQGTGDTDGGNCGEEEDYCDHCFDHIQTAIDCDNVLPGDTLHIEASGETYADVIHLDKRLHLIGTGYFLGDNPGLQDNQIYAEVRTVYVELGADGSVIEGLSFEIFNSNDIRFYANVDDITITRCRIDGSVVLGHATVEPVLTNIVITKNWISEKVETIFNFAQGVQGLELTNNHIQGELDMNENSTGVVAHNILGQNILFWPGIEFYNNISTDEETNFQPQTGGCSNIYNNIFTSVEVGDLEDCNWFEQVEASILKLTGTPEEEVENSVSCSICNEGYVAGGPDDAVIGIYGGLEAQQYIKAGIPAVPTIYNLSGTNAAYPGGEINLEISTRSND
jgi:hypothetical protein